LDACWGSSSQRRLAPAVQRAADPNTCPVLPASYPDSWPREFPGAKYAGFYTFNDNVMGDVVDVMALAFQV